MLEITRKNCYKCDLETVIDNNSQYFWINLRDFEVETESKWLNIFNKHGNKSTLKYRRELTPDIKFQADRIFVRNDLFEQVIKNCKATSTEFLMFKEKLAICLYEKPIEKLFKVSNEKSTKNLIEEWDEYSNEESDNESDKKSDNESIEEIGKISNKKSTKKISKKFNEYLDENSDEMFKKSTKTKAETKMKVQQIGMIKMSSIKY